MRTTAVIIARFQTPYLHEGHCHLIETIRAKHHRVVVVLGVTPVKGSKRNPYDFYTRERLLKATYPDLFVLPLSDQPSDAIWSAKLDNLLQSTFPSEPFLLYGGRDSFIPFYSGKLTVEALHELHQQSATNIRNEESDRVLDSKDFRLGINYAYHNSYAKVYPTVDIAVYKDERTLLLLGRKEGVQTWRLPGGFTDVTDDNFEAAARRELIEECGTLETGAMQYIGSAKIDDWRYRSEENKIMTLLFATDLIYGDPKANDDLAELQWFAVADLSTLIIQNKITPEHKRLIEMLLKQNATVTQNIKTV